MGQFEEYKSDLTEEQVINYLLSWQHRGLKVMTGRPLVHGGWSIEFGENKWVGVRPNPSMKGSWQTVHTQGVSRGMCGTLEELKMQLEGLVHALGVEVNLAPKQHNTSKDSPLNVWVQLNSMVSSASITAIYDPFFDNQTLRNLADLAALDTKFNKDLRILTIQKKPSLNFLEKFNKQLGINAEVRLANKNHPRLVFLSDERCLSPDFSLNVEQTGTISTVEYRPKILFFDEAWKTAELMPTDNN